MPVQDYPNPLAAIICEHDLPIAEKHRLHVSAYFEFALPTGAIPPEGIMFENDFVVYADWEFFSQQISGALNVGINISVFSASKDLSPSLQLRAIERLKDSGRKGCVRVPYPSITTDIEGDNCIVVVCDGVDTFPVLLKSKRLKYPMEFLGYITSALTFYGELLPLPISVLGMTYKEALLARAIGYLHQ